MAGALTGSFNLRRLKRAIEKKHILTVIIEYLPSLSDLLLRRFVTHKRSLEARCIRR